MAADRISGPRRWLHRAAAFVGRAEERPEVSGAALAAGYSRAYNVLEGFEGDKDASGQRGHVNGWRKARLPWVQG